MSEEHKKAIKDIIDTLQVIYEEEYSDIIIEACIASLKKVLAEVPNA